MTILTEADVEQAALDWLATLGWQVVYGPEIAHDTPNAERGDFGQVVLERRVQDSLTSAAPPPPGPASFPSSRTPSKSPHLRTRTPPSSSRRPPRRCGTPPPAGR